MEKEWDIQGQRGEKSDERRGNGDVGSVEERKRQEAVVMWKGEMEHGAVRKERERERRRQRSRAVVDITAVIHLSDSLPNAPLGETQRCVTAMQHMHSVRVHSFASTCAHTHTHAEEIHVYDPGFRFARTLGAPCRGSMVSWGTQWVSTYAVTLQPVQAPIIATGARHTHTCINTHTHTRHICWFVKTLCIRCNNPIKSNKSQGQFTQT